MRSGNDQQPQTVANEAAKSKLNTKIYFKRPLANRAVDDNTSHCDPPNVNNVRNGSERQAVNESGPADDLDNILNNYPIEQKNTRKTPTSVKCKLVTRAVDDSTNQVYMHGLST